MTVIVREASASFYHGRRQQETVRPINKRHCSRATTRCYTTIATVQKREHEHHYTSYAQTASVHRDCDLAGPRHLIMFYHDSKATATDSELRSDRLDAEVAVPIVNSNPHGTLTLPFDLDKHVVSNKRAVQFTTDDVGQK